MSQITLGTFCLDPRQRVLWRDGVAVELGGRAFDILRTLIAAKGALVSKDTLMAEVWPAQIVEDNTLQAQISGLRKALGESGQRAIATVPGRGYRFVFEDAALATNPLPRGRPSIAVMAFDNLSGDPGDECFADGMAEDLITELSRSRSWLVVARSSSFTFKGRRVDIRQIGQDLGVRYVLQGSIRRAGNRIRVTAQLIEAEGGVHVWADRYDHLLQDLFTLQDDITLAVSRAIEPAVENAERLRVLRKRPEGLDAWEACKRAQSHIDAGEWDSVDIWLRRSIALDPGFAAPHGSRAFFLWSSALAGRLPFQPTHAEAEIESRAAIKLDPDEPMGHAVLSMCRSGVRDWSGALHSAVRAVELGPSVWTAQCAMTLAHAGARRFTEAVRHLDLLRQIGPRGTGRRVSLFLAAFLDFARGEYDRAAEGAAAVIAAHPDYPHPYWILLASLGHLGCRDEASTLFPQWIAVAPGQAAQFTGPEIPWLAPEDSRRVLEGLRAAGWDPEIRPSP